MAYLIALFCAPVFAMLSYYLGLIVMTKAKIKQKDNDFVTHLLRIVFGFLVLSCIGVILLSISYLIS